MVDIIKFIILIFILFLTHSCSQGKKETFNKNDMNYSRLKKDNRFTNTPLEDLANAAKERNLDKVEKIVISNPEFLKYKDPEFDFTILFWAVYYDQYELTKKLLELGADPNFESYKLNTPFVKACSKIETSKFIELLLKYNGKVNDTIRYKKSYFLTPLIAASSANLRSVKILVKNGAFINAYFPYGLYKNALHATQASPERIETASYLILEKKADFSKPLVETIQGDTLYFIDLLKDFYFRETETKRIKLKKDLIQYIEERSK